MNTSTATHSYHELLAEKTIQFGFNPFGGLSEAEKSVALQPKYDLEAMAESLLDDPPQLIEFLGRKGRGKTTHLVALHNMLPDTPIFLLDQERLLSKINLATSSILFIDSIQKVPILERQQLWKNPRLSIVYTTHIPRYWAKMIAAKNFNSYSFKGINAKELEKMIRARLQLAATHNLPPYQFEPHFIQQLIRLHGDHIRGIMNQLYDEFYKLRMGNGDSF